MEGGCDSSHDHLRIVPEMWDFMGEQRIDTKVDIWVGEIADALLLCTLLSL
jgi:hypothetical protein